MVVAAYDKAKTRLVSAKGFDFCNVSLNSILFIGFTEYTFLKDIGFHMSLTETWVFVIEVGYGRP